MVSVSLSWFRSLNLLEDSRILRRGLRAHDPQSPDPSWDNMIVHLTGRIQHRQIHHGWINQLLTRGIHGDCIWSCNLHLIGMCSLFGIPGKLELAVPATEPPGQMSCLDCGVHPENLGTNAALLDGRTGTGSGSCGAVLSSGVFKVPLLGLTSRPSPSPGTSNSEDPKSSSTITALCDSAHKTSASCCVAANLTNGSSSESTGVALIPTLPSGVSEPVRLGPLKSNSKASNNVINWLACGCFGDACLAIYHQPHSLTRVLKSWWAPGEEGATTAPTKGLSSLSLVTTSSPTGWMVRTLRGPGLDASPVREPLKPYSASRHHQSVHHVRHRRRLQQTVHSRGASGNQSRQQTD